MTLGLYEMEWSTGVMRDRMKRNGIEGKGFEYLVQEYRETVHH